MVSPVSLLESQSPTLSSLFTDTSWLGARHGGQFPVSFENYETDQSQFNATIRSLPHPQAAKLQAQLTFGLLEAVTEAKLTEGDLLCTVTTDNDPITSRTAITSYHVPRLLSDWRCRIQKLSDRDQAHKWAGRVQTTFQQARRLLETKVMHPKGPFSAAQLDHRAHAQIVMQIGGIIEMLVSSSHAFSQWDVRPQGFSCSFLLEPHSVIRDHMMSKGWCPFTIKILSESVSMLSYAAICEPVVRESSEDHGQCSREGCVRNNIANSDEYRPGQHVRNHCHCQNLAAGDEVKALLCQGKIPVIQKGPATETCLRPADAATTKYVAISHVWADGLGSTAEVGIPLCQIDRILAKTRMEVHGGTFWMDSLCVPKERPLRKKAIGLMERTYRDAAAVIVLDSAIQSLSESMPRELKLLRILSSGWMQRLWTLQEGVLAKTILFAFVDELVRLENLIPGYDDLVSNPVAADLASELFRLSMYRGATMTISDISCALRWRTTRLLNVQASTLVDLSAEQRMSTLLLKVGTIPHNIIFLPGSKLKKPGFRWAPATFMGANSLSLNFGSTMARCKDTGLWAEYFAAQFPTLTVDSQSTWLIRDASTTLVYKVDDLSSQIDAARPDDPANYCCNIVLLQNEPRPYLMTYGAAVCGAQEPVVDVNGQVVSVQVCEFRSRIAFRQISEDELRQATSPLIVDGILGQMSVVLS
ncbi:uncharacterized protein BDW47DRAFT_132600 [Aspergillus candidus]|uniref:Heterokaryon incompatibility domain-containing protein n=1 Tax=Aspergillus candidus TaxID=41067 RepID=A0A2I2F858_ASPCN|nr:hypothetical protein BDW47DRAFT_132600 [Aspergillus candidus]PLB36801.1 hypothetical protein BDW47DRAFT_132600 [Aspergillus candidus]